MGEFSILRPLSAFRFLIEHLGEAMRTFFSIFLSLTMSCTVMAQEFFNAYHVPAYALNASANVYSGYNLRNALFPKRHDSVSGRSSTRRTDTVPSTTFKPTIESSATLHNMAALVAVEQQSKTLEELKQALFNYKKIEAKLHLPKNDVASGLAAFIAGNYMAYHNTSIPDAAYQTLVQQMRTVLVSNAAFSKETDAQKQTMYEQLASIGMYMATEQYLLSKNPNDSLILEMRKASKQAFESFFKMDIERIKITDKGVIDTSY